MTLAEELQRLAPFGRGNPGVSLLVADATFRDGRPMGDGKHVRFTVESRGARARAVAFGTGGRLPVEDGAPAEATFSLEINEWNGVTEPRLVLRQARAASSPSADPELPSADPELPSADPELPSADPELPSAAQAPPPAVTAAEEELVLFALP
jgi:single-stranded-DNA-specific exonuclease